MIVAEYELIKPCLPPELQNLVEKAPSEEALLEQIIASSWANRLRLIPFSSIGRKNGMLLGVRADEVVLNIGTKDIVHTNTVIGIYRERLNPQGSYQLLIPADMVGRIGGIAMEIRGLLKSWQMNLIRLYIMKMIPQFIHYIGSTEVLPPPLQENEEMRLIALLEQGEAGVKAKLIEHNLRLVVYIAKKFENTGINIEDPGLYRHYRPDQGS